MSRKASLPLLAAGLALVLVGWWFGTDGAHRARARSDGPAREDAGERDDPRPPARDPAATTAGPTTDGDRADGRSDPPAPAERPAEGGAIRFLPHATTGGTGRTQVLADAPAPHFAVALPEGETSESSTSAGRLRVEILGRGRQVDASLEARRAEPDDGTLPAGAVPYELAGLDRLPNDPERTWRGFVVVHAGGGTFRKRFEVVHHVARAGVALGYDASLDARVVNVDATLHAVEGLQAVSIRLYRGRSEVPLDFFELHIGGRPVPDVIREGARIDKAMLWASSVAPERLRSLADVVAVIDLRCNGGRTHSAVWRASPD